MGRSGLGERVEERRIEASETSVAFTRLPEGLLQRQTLFPLQLPSPSQQQKHKEFFLSLDFTLHPRKLVLFFSIYIFFFFFAL